MRHPSLAKIMACIGGSIARRARSFRRAAAGARRDALLARLEVASRAAEVDHRSRAKGR